MSLNPAERQQFEHQPEIADLIEVSPLPESFDMPPHNVILPPNPATENLSPEYRLPPVAESEEDAAVEDLLNGLATYRDHERRLAGYWKSYVEFGEGPYVNINTGGRPQLIHDATLTTKDQLRPATAEDIYGLQKASLDAERQAIVDKLSERVKTGDGKRILERLKATADKITTGASAASTESNTTEATLQNQTNRHSIATSRHHNRINSVTSSPATVEDAAKKITGDEELGKPKVRFLSRRKTRRERQDQIRKADEKIAKKDAELETARMMSSSAPQITVNRNGERVQVSNPTVIGGTTQEGYDLYVAQVANAAARNANAWSNGDTHTRDDGTVIEYLKPYGEMMSDVIKDARKERDRHFNSANAEITHAGEELTDDWPIDYGENPSVENRVIGLLNYGNNHVNHLSTRDGGRGDLIDKANQVNFRMMQRQVTAHALNGDDRADYRVFYTDDGGIYYNTSKGPRIVYEDGSRSAIENDMFVRRQGNGKKWEAPAEAITLSDADTARLDQLRADPVMTAGDWLRECNDTFEQWESSRNPVDKLRAATYAEIANERMEDETTRLKSAEIDWRADRIMEIQDILTAGTAGDPAAEQALRDEENQLRADIQPHLDLHKRRREAINTGMYWLGTLKAEAIPGPESPQRRVGWAALRSTIDSESSLAPYVQADGVVHWNGATLHTIKGDWQIHPNGKATLHQPFKDDATGAKFIRHTEYSPDGSTETVTVTAV